MGAVPYHTVPLLPGVSSTGRCGGSRSRVAGGGAGEPSAERRMSSISICPAPRFFQHLDEKIDMPTRNWALAFNGHVRLTFRLSTN
eukprot:4493201-Prymnesium_polylepis.1